MCRHYHSYSPLTQGVQIPVVQARSCSPLGALCKLHDREVCCNKNATKNCNLFISHLTCRGATPRDHRILPRRIILVRHAESEGNIDNFAYTYVPDPQVPLVSPRRKGICVAFFFVCPCLPVASPVHAN